MIFGKSGHGSRKRVGVQPVLNTAINLGAIASWCDHNNCLNRWGIKVRIGLMLLTLGTVNAGNGDPKSI